MEILHHHQDFNSHLKIQNLATLGPYLFTVTTWNWGAVAPLGPSSVLQIDIAPTSPLHLLSSLPDWYLRASELLLLMNGNYFRFFKAGGQIWKGQSYSGWSGIDRQEEEKVKTEKLVRRLSRSDRRWKDFSWVIPVGWESSRGLFPYCFNLLLTILCKLHPPHHLSPSPALSFCIMLTTTWHSGCLTYLSVYYLSPLART